MKASLALLARIRKFVTPAGKDECWEFSGKTRHRHGYGLMRIEGKIVGAHRIAYIVGNGPIPRGLCVCHTCDNPPCCNPDHLYAGTQQDNVRDREKRGRTAKGPKRAALQREICRRGADHQDAKLDDAKVRFIRQAHAEGFSQQSLADKYGVSQPAVSALIRRKTWSHVT